MKFILILFVFSVSIYSSELPRKWVLSHKLSDCGVYVQKIINPFLRTNKELSQRLSYFSYLYKDDRMVGNDPTQGHFYSLGGALNYKLKSLIHNLVFSVSGNKQNPIIKMELVDQVIHKNISVTIDKNNRAFNFDGATFDLVEFFQQLKDPSVEELYKLIPAMNMITNIALKQMQKMRFKKGYFKFFKKMKRALGARKVKKLGLFNGDPVIEIEYTNNSERIETVYVIVASGILKFIAKSELLTGGGYTSYQASYWSHFNFDLYLSVTDSIDAFKFESLFNKSSSLTLSEKESFESFLLMMKSIQ